MTESAPLLNGATGSARTSNIEDDARDLLSGLQAGSMPADFKQQALSRQLVVMILAWSSGREIRCDIGDEARQVLLSETVDTWKACIQDFGSLWIHERSCSGTSGLSVMSLLAAMLGNDRIARIMLQDEAFVQSLGRTWSTGLVSPVNTISFIRRHNVDRGNQPWLQHLWSLTAYIVLLALSVSLAIKPSQQDTIHRLNGRDIAWLVMGWGHIAEIMYLRRRSLQLLFLLPTLVALLLVALGQPTFSSTAYSWICWSLPLLLIRLLFPLYPSLVLLNPTDRSSTLPLATVMHGIFKRIFQVMRLLAPLILFVFAIFSWALNGDVFRGFNSVSSGNPAITIPIEEGVAPYEARVALASTILLLLLMALLLGNARAAVPAEVNDGDAWVMSFGRITASDARQALVAALLDSGVGLEVVSESHASQDPEDQYGSTSTTIGPATEDRSLAMKAPALIPPFNVVGLALATFPAALLRTLGRNPDLARNYEREVKWWIWRLTTGWASYLIVQTIDTFRRVFNAAD